MAKNFHELRNKMSPEAQEKARMLTQKYTAEMPVDELRAARPGPDIVDRQISIYYATAKNGRL